MILYGASGHAKVILEILSANGIEVNHIIDDSPRSEALLGIPVIKNSGEINFTNAVISIGSNAVRKKISEDYLLNYITAIHPSAIISPSAEIGEGTVVMAGVVVNANAKIGSHCILNTSSVIEHDCVLEDFVHISPNAALAGNVSVGEGAHIGIGASVIQGVKIGKWAVVGAGSAVIRDVSDFATVGGAPAKIIKTGKC